MTYKSSATPLILLVAFILLFGLVFALLIYGGALGWILIGFLLICVFLANRVIRKKQTEKENELARYTQIPCNLDNIKQRQAEKT